MRRLKSLNSFKGVVLSATVGATLIISTAQASPWVEADDVYLRASIQQLADAGHFKGNTATYPLMWSGIARDLRTIDVADLSQSERLAYYRVRSALNFAQRERIDTVRFQGSTERVRPQGFADTNYEHGAVSGSRSFVSDHSAGRLKTTFRAGTPDNKYYTFDGSYLATTVGNWALSVDQMPVWWGQGQENALVLSTNSRPIQGVRLNRLQDDPSQISGLSLLGNWHATAFYGRTQSHGPLGDQEVAGVRASIRPFRFATLATSYTVETGSSLGNRNQIAGLDGRITLPLSIAVYGEVAERYGQSRVSDSRAFTIGVDHYLPFGRNLQQVFIEYTDVPAYFYDDQTDPEGFRRWQQNMGAAIDQDVESLSLGYRFQRSDGTAWRISVQDQSIGSSNYLVSQQHDVAIGTFSVERQVVNVKFQQALGETLLSYGLVYTRDNIRKSDLETITNQHSSRTTEHDVSARIGWEFRY